MGHYSSKHQPSIAETDLTHRFFGPVARRRLHVSPVPAPKPTGLTLDGPPCRDVPQYLDSRACDPTKLGHLRRRTSGDIETVATKPAFPEAFRWGRRCLVPVDELFEWAETQTGQQHRIHYRLPRALF